MTTDTVDILIVDDTPANLHLLFGMLHRRGYLVRAAPDGPTALKAAGKKHPDLILLDIHMPGMNGYEVCRILKADEDLCDVPVIFISALNETLDKVKAFGCGGVDYITKPFHFGEVEARIDTHLRLRRQQLEIQAQYNALRDMETLRDDLVHMIVHDLRNPLTTFSMCSQVVRREQRDLTEKSSMCLDRSEAAFTDMMRMIDELLDISRLEHGEMPLHDVDTDIPGLLADLTERRIAAPKKARVRLDLAPGQAATAVCDPSVIVRVINNLIDNALKFTPADGDIRVGMTTECDCIRIDVTDTGPGIPEAHRERIFEKFRRVDQDKPRDVRQSTGLGLTFCKLAVSRHGGEIGVEASDSGGCRFWFTLPVADPTVSNQDATAESDQTVSV